MLSPLGLLLPGYFKAGDAWGEWGADTIRGIIGYIPQGLAKIASLWKAPMPDYALTNSVQNNPSSASLSYLLSALIGVFSVVVVTLLIAKLLSKKEKK